VTRPPEFHYAEADRLLAELAAVKADQFAYPFVQAKVARAQIHAQLAQCPDWYADDCPDSSLVAYGTHAHIETYSTTGDVL
jgi:hypothetical protein